MKIEKPVENKRPVEAPAPAVEEDAFDDVWADLRDAKRDEFYLRGLLQRANEGKKEVK